MANLNSYVKCRLERALEVQEGRVPHMYQCTEGRVTIGIGHQIVSAEAAGRLNLRKQIGRDLWVDASRDEKIAEYRTIDAITPRNNREFVNRPANSYRASTSLRMSDREMDILRDEHISNFHRELRRRFPDFDDFPNNVQLALFDMAFNIGMTNFSRDKWPLLHAAIDNKNWEEAARQSNRPQIGAKRNNYVRDLFLSAARNGNVTENAADECR